MLTLMSPEKRPVGRESIPPEWLLKSALRFRRSPEMETIEPRFDDSTEPDYAGRGPPS